MKIRDTQLGEVVYSHYLSLPVWRRCTGGIGRHWPWLLVFVVTPGLVGAGVAVLNLVLDVPVKGAPAAFVAGVGVLAGFLFQVLAWIGSRIGEMAERLTGRPAGPDELGLLGKLDIARTNVAYATIFSIVGVLAMATAQMVASDHVAYGVVSAALLTHLALTLVLVALRINNIGRSDRVDALIAHTRGHAHDHAPGPIRTPGPTRAPSE